MPTLTGYRCGNCGFLFLAPRDRCTRCGRDQKHEVLLSGRGRIRAWTTIHVAPARYREEAPYTVVLVELEEGGRLMGRLEAGQVAVRDAAILLREVDPERGPVFSLAGDPS